MLAFAGSFLALAWNADAILNREQHNAARLSRASEMKKIQEVEMEKLRNEGKVPCAYVERVIGTDSGMNVTARSVVKVEECRVVEIRNAELKANLLFEFPNFPDLPEKEVVKILKKRGYIWVVPLEQAISEAEDNRERDRLISIFGSKALKESQKMF